MPQGSGQATRSKLQLRTNMSYDISFQTKTNTGPDEFVCDCLHMSVLISPSACCLLLKRAGSENMQSSSYLSWAGKVDSAEQAAPGGRGGGRVPEWTSCPSPPYKNGYNVGCYSVWGMLRFWANGLRKGSLKMTQTFLLFFLCSMNTAE